MDAHIEAGEDALIQGSGQRVEHPDGLIRLRTQAGTGGRIIDSPITIVGAAPPSAPPPPRAVAAATLTISVVRGAEGYRAEARFSRSDSRADVSVGPQPLTLNFTTLRACWPDADAYGMHLSKALFAPAALRDVFLQALVAAQTLRVPLQFRLQLDSADPELQQVYWETLRHPDSGAPLITSQHLHVARYLGSHDWVPVDPSPSRTLRALGIIAAPNDLADYKLPTINDTAEELLARTVLQRFNPTILGPGSATVSRIGSALRDGCDILYLVAHGALINGQSRLWLEHDDGRAYIIAGEELALRISEMRRRPLLAVLICCHSAGRGATDVAAALGPRLIAAGVLAVVAMQGNFTMPSAARFTPALFKALAADGNIDQAIGEARAAIRERPDWWMPVLFSRLRDGMIR